ncbi:MAG: alpha/beta hydrolase [Candidatus Nealsonbacteria bacterium]|nr:alpha/beta hydrolase [Candidatus Nealsonbacteria bacterium]
MENNQKSIVILHGWYSLKERWQKVKEIVEKEGIKAEIPDLPGFKEETKLNNPWSLNDYLNWMEKFIEDKKNSGELTEPFFLLGHSFGGRIAIKFAIKHPEKLKGLILLSAAGIKSKENFIANSSLIFKQLHFLPGYDLFRKFFYKFILRKTDYIKLEGIMKETFKNVINEDLSDLLAEIKVKTLILWGGKDNVTPLSDAYFMKEKIVNSKLEILEGLNHTAYFENPEIVGPKILDFIEEK